MKIFKSIIITTIIFFITLLICTILFYFMDNIKINALYLILTITIYISLSFTLSNQIRKKGILIGLLISIILTTIFIIFNIINKTKFDAQLILKYLISSLLALSFGAIGVNFKQIIK